MSIEVIPVLGDNGVVLGQMVSGLPEDKNKRLPKPLDLEVARALYQAKLRLEVAGYTRVSRRDDIPNAIILMGEA